MAGTNLSKDLIPENTPLATPIVTLTIDRKKTLFFLGLGLICSAMALAYLWFFTSGGKEAYIIFLAPSIATSVFFAQNLFFFLNPYKISAYEDGIYISGLGLVPWNEVCSVNYVEMPHSPLRRYRISPPDKLYIDLHFSSKPAVKLKNKTGMSYSFTKNPYIVSFKISIFSCLTVNPKKFEKTCTDLIFKNLPNPQET